VNDGDFNINAGGIERFIFYVCSGFTEGVTWTLTLSYNKVCWFNSLRHALLWPGLAYRRTEMTVRLHLKGSYHWYLLLVNLVMMINDFLCMF